MLCRWSRHLCHEPAVDPESLKALSLKSKDHKDPKPSTPTVPLHTQVLNPPGNPKKVVVTMGPGGDATILDCGSRQCEILPPGVNKGAADEFRAWPWGA